MDSNHGSGFGSDMSELLQPKSDADREVNQLMLQAQKGFFQDISLFPKFDYLLKYINSEEGDETHRKTLNAFREIMKQPLESRMQAFSTRETKLQAMDALNWEYLYQTTINSCEQLEYKDTQVHLEIRKYSQQYTCVTKTVYSMHLDISSTIPIIIQESVLYNARALVVG